MTGPSTVGGWQLIRRIGEGGMGTVYLAERDGVRVALKMIREDLAHDPVLRQRFRHEVELVQRMRGPYLPMFIGADPDATEPWLATRYIEGTSLDAHVREQGPLAAAEVSTLAGSLGSALQALHAAGIIHRDVKPNNVILGPEGPVLVDLGVSKASDLTNLTETGLAVGTLSWSAPELLRGEPPGPASDVFALASCLAYATTGKNPFPGMTVEAVVMRVLEGQPDLGNFPPGPLRELVSAALQPDPALRPGAVAFIAPEAFSSNPTLPGVALGRTAVNRATVAPMEASRRSRFGTWAWIVLLAAVLAVVGAVYAFVRVDDRPSRLGTTGTSTSGNQAASTTEPTEATTVASTTTTVATTTTAATTTTMPGLAAFDFRNHTYTDVCGHTITLNNGTWSEGERGYSDTVYAFDEHIVDLTSDGEPEAIITFSCSPGSHAYPYIFVFTNSPNGPVQLGQSIEEGFIKADADGLVTVVPVYLDGDAMCCPSRSEQTRYQLIGGRWEPVAVETIYPDKT